MPRKKKRFEDGLEGIGGSMQKMRSSAMTGLSKQEASTIKQQVDKVPELQKEEKKQVMSKIKDPSKINPNSGKISDRFAQAMTFFAPQVLGALGGFLFEGEAGAIAGAQQGAQAGQALTAFNQLQLENERKERELTLKEQRAISSIGPKAKTFQQARDTFIEEEGQLVPAVFDPNTKQIFSSLTGKVVTDPKKIRVGEARRQKTFELDRQKAGQLANTQVETIANFTNSLTGLERINQLKTNVNTGPFAGRGQNIASKVGQASPDFVQLQAETENAKASFLKALSGAQVSDAEAKRLAKIIPNVNDDDVTFEAKSKAYNRIIQRHREAIVEAISKEQPLRADVLQDLKKEASIFEPGSMSDTQRSRLKELRAKKRGGK